MPPALLLYKKTTQFPLSLNFVKFQTVTHQAELCQFLNNQSHNYNIKSEPISAERINYI